MKSDIEVNCFNHLVSHLAEPIHKPVAILVPFETQPIAVVASRMHGFSHGKFTGTFGQRGRTKAHTVVGPLHDDSRSLRALVPAGCIYWNKQLTIWPACSGAYGLRALDLSSGMRAV